MGSNETKDWGIWFSGKSYMVPHFLKTLGPKSKVMRFTTKLDAETFVAGRCATLRYEVRLIPNPKPTPGKNLTQSQMNRIDDMI